MQASDWVNNPIDAFILAKLETHGLTPATPASKLTLIRRVYYDLTGLPPSPEAVEAFLNDIAPDAYEKLIDKLLKSPRYGEKWGRHWLDLVRYAETNGYEGDSDKPFVWRYRDYVINAFNKNKPYDQFIKEQLAGDELNAVTTETVIATGYHKLGVWDDGPADRKLARYDYLDDIVSTTGQVMLGMTIGCARCHDHKIDPIQRRITIACSRSFMTSRLTTADRLQTLALLNSRQCIISNSLKSNSPNKKHRMISSTYRKPSNRTRKDSSRGDSPRYARVTNT